MIYTLTYDSRRGFHHLRDKSLSSLKSGGNLLISCGVVPSSFMFIADSKDNVVSSLKNGFWVDYMGNHRCLNPKK